MTVLPSLSSNALIINSSACQIQGASCPQTTAALWTQSGADVVSIYNKTWSDALPSSDWDATYTALLGISGTGRFFSERMSLYPYGGGPYFLGVVTGVSNSYKVTFPGGAGYILNTGFVS